MSNLIIKNVDLVLLKDQLNNMDDTVAMLKRMSGKKIKKQRESLIPIIDMLRDAGYQARKRGE